MQTLIFILVFSLCSLSKIYSQTQGDNEISWVKHAYLNEYSQTKYERFRISVKKEANSSYRFDDRIILTHDTSQELEHVLFNGLFYPQVVMGDSTIKYSPEMDNNFSRVLQNDTITIGSFKQVYFGPTDIKTRRFVLYISTKGLMNPSLYTLEISNKDATKETTMSSFYKNATLTFWKFISLLM